MKTCTKFAPRSIKKINPENLEISGRGTYDLPFVMNLIYLLRTVRTAAEPQKQLSVVFSPNGKGLTFANLGARRDNQNVRESCSLDIIKIKKAQPKPSLLKIF